MRNAAPTIVAPASGQGRAGIAVIRLSGSDVRTVVTAVAGPLPPPRVASLRRLGDPRTGEMIDRGLVLWFPSPASFTGEDMAELHVHGGRGVVAAALAALIEGCGCRMAEPGEFARRAFANGKLDLAEVEGLADLIDAETDAQRRQALRQLDGVLGRQVERWTADLLGLSAWAEAALDFSDEADVPAQSLASALPVALRVADEIEAVLQDGRGERLREGLVVAIAGPPNAGKSTLLNALARRDAAIVSPIPGTTRDVIEVKLDLGGLPVLLVDTAGIRDSSDPIELEGIARTRRHLALADVVLWLESSIEADDASAERPKGAILVRTKADLTVKSDSEAEYSEEIVNLSAVTGEGIAGLLARLESLARARLGSGDGLVTRHRHRTALTDAVAHLRRALLAFESGLASELVAEDVRLALRALGRISGRVGVEDVLGAIFSQFCIGK